MYNLANSVSCVFFSFLFYVLLLLFCPDHAPPGKTTPFALICHYSHGLLTKPHVNTNRPPCTSKDHLIFRRCYCHGFQLDAV